MHKLSSCDAQQGAKHCGKAATMSERRPLSPERSFPSTKSLRDMALVLGVVLIWDLFRVL
tara:strand:+ start:1109 stop:1288 length:180 start_codon:yes stop_codon:yes gene_type:complete